MGPWQQGSLSWLSFSCVNRAVGPTRFSNSQADPGSSSSKLVIKKLFDWAEMARWLMGEEKGCEGWGRPVPQVLQLQESQLCLGCELRAVLCPVGVCTCVCVCVREWRLLGPNSPQLSPNICIPNHAHINPPSFPPSLPFPPSSPPPTDLELTLLPWSPSAGIRGVHSPGLVLCVYVCVNSCVCRCLCTCVEARTQVLVSFLRCCLFFF